MDHPAQILLDRRKKRGSLLEWASFVEGTKGQTPALHHQLIIETLEKVTRGEEKNVILLMPPGAAKSTYTSIDFVVWYLNQFPTHLILACSYSYSLIEGFGRQCRDLIELYKKDLGYELSKSAAASGDWRINKGGGYFCAGVGSGIAGHRADLAFIDDYLGSQQDADSETIRETQWKWYWNDFWPRLKPTAAQIIIANRRHEDDLVGRLLAKDPSSWKVIRLPYFAEENDPIGRKPGVKWNEKTEKMEYDLSSRLWPEWFDENHARKVLSLDSRVLAGLYQQRPAPDEGNFFKRSMLVPYSIDDLATAERNGLRYYVGADYAVRKGTETDRFCFVCGGVDQGGRLWVLPDWWWCKADTLEAVDAMIEMGRRRRPLCWWAGRENITGAIAPFLTKRMQEKNVFIPIEELSEAKDKRAKAQSIMARMSQRMVLFPKFNPSWNEAESELLGFPGATHDDFVDALANLGRGLDKMMPASGPEVEPPDIGGYKFKPTLGWLKKSHESQIAFQKARLLDK